MPGPGIEAAAADGRSRGGFRASHADREQVIGTLKAAYIEGRLTEDELDARVDQAYASRTYAALAEVTADIPGAPRLDGRPAPARRWPLARAAVTSVSCQAARHPEAEPAFELHLTTAAEDAKVIDGHQRDGDPDLVLHFAVCRQAGRLLGPGLPAAEVFSPVPDGLVTTEMPSGGSSPRPSVD